MQEKPVYFNGYNIESGKYSIKPTNSSNIITKIKNDRILKDQFSHHFDEAILRYEAEKNGHSYNLSPELAPDDLSQTGWGVLFVADDPLVGSIELALKPLLDLRKEQAKDKFFCYKGRLGYQNNMNKNVFWRQHDMTWGQLDTRFQPFYLLLIGSPEQIPYEFEYELNLQFAVGRIHFHSLEEYSHYAQNVVACERNIVKRSKRITLFATDHDQHTHLGASQLMRELANSMQDNVCFSDWQLDSIIGNKASKLTLNDLLTARDNYAPAILLSTTHGVVCHPSSAQQKSLQGGLLCKPYIEEGSTMDVSRDAATLVDNIIYGGADLGQDVNLQGLIHFCFSSFSAGTSKHDEWYNLVNGQGPRIISNEHFCAYLPQRMLGHGHGALAFVGYVGPMWDYGFNCSGLMDQTRVIHQVLDHLVQGKPLGYAMEAYRSYYVWALQQCELQFKQLIQHRHFQHQDLSCWAARNDARHCVIFGDPAVRLVYEPLGISESLPKQQWLDHVPHHDPHNDSYHSIVSMQEEPYREQEDVITSLKSLNRKISQALGNTFTQWTRIEVKTYQSTTVDEQSPELAQKPVYHTKISLEDDTLQIIATDQTNSEGDLAQQDRLWQHHKEAIEQTRAYRLELLKLLAELVAKLPK